jgi:hypothetical protein
MPEAEVSLQGGVVAGRCHCKQRSDDAILRLTCRGTFLGRGIARCFAPRNGNVTAGHVSRFTDAGY